MDKIKYIVVLMLVYLPSTLHAEDNNPYADVIEAIDNAAEAERVPKLVLRSLCWVESSFNANPKLKKDGNSYSYGLCQIKLITARHMGFRGKPSELKNPHINARLAAKYLRYHLNNNHNDWIKAVSAYNAGHYTTNNLKYVNKVVSKVFSYLN